MLKNVVLYRLIGLFKSSEFHLIRVFSKVFMYFLEYFANLNYRFYFRLINIDQSHDKFVTTRLDSLG